MKIGIIADQHIGVRGDSQIFSEYCISYLRDCFIPTMKSHGIQHIVHLGDVFDRRKYINFKTLSDWRTNFFDVLYDNSLTLHVILGNHDVYYKDTNQINSMQLLTSYSNIFVYETPTLVDLNGYKVMMCPWIPSGQEQFYLNELDQARTDICFGHFELIGFDMFKGHESTHGLNPSVLDKFKVVLSGHYHHKSQKKNITYVGSPYPMTWSDYGDDRGYHIFDFSDRSLQFFKNPNSIFHKFTYNDQSLSFESLSKIDFSQFTNKYIRVNIECKNDPFLLDNFLEKLYFSNPVDVSIIDSTLHKKQEDAEVDVTKDTLSLLVDYIKDLTLQNESDMIDFMSNLYKESLSAKIHEGS